jgi:hypothetical protein
MLARRSIHMNEEEKRARVKAKIAELQETFRARAKLRRDQPPPDALTLELLQSTLDEELDKLVARSVFGQWRTTKGKLGKQADIRVFLQSVSPGMWMVYITRCVEAEVNNGGFHQFFYNSSGKLAQDSIACYELLNSPAYADLMRRAIACLEQEAEMQAEIRREKSIETFFGSYKKTNLGNLDKEFYAMEKTSPLQLLRVRYIREHPQEFIVG